MSPSLINVLSPGTEPLAPTSLDPERLPAYTCEGVLPITLGKPL
jgi:hypothetical protein